MISAVAVPVVALALLGGPEETSPAPPQPSAPGATTGAVTGGPTTVAKTSMPITLQQAVYLTEKNSLALQGERVGVQIASAAVGSTLGTFDTVAFLSGQYTKNIRPSASSLEGGFGSVTVIPILDESWNVNGGFRGTLLNGATYQADIDWNKDFSSPAPFSLFNPSYTSSIGIAFTQPLLRGFGPAVNKAPMLRARNELYGAAESLEESRILRAQEVVVAYWNHYFARRLLGTREFLVEQAEKLVNINQKKFDVGEMKRIDVLEAQSDLAQRNQELIVAKNEIGRTADALKRLIFPFDDKAQWEVELVPLTEANESPVEPPEWEEAAKVALERRPELRSRRELLKNNDIDIVVAENGILPQFDLNASLRFSQLAMSKGQVLNYDKDFYSVGAGFSLEMPLGNRTARYQLSIARLQKIQALLDYKNTENTVIQEVRNGVRDVRNSVQEIQAAHEATRLAFERWTQEQKRQEVGFSTTFQVRDAQAVWRQAVDTEIQALYTYQVNLAALLTAQGTLLEQFGVLPAPRPVLDDDSGIFHDP